MTVADAAKTTGEKGLVYKTFLIKEQSGSGNVHKISFDSDMPETMTDEEKLDLSYDLLAAQGGTRSNMRLWKANPVLFREFKYKYTIDSDVLNPRSAELTRAYDIETFDKAIQSPVANQETLYKDLLMGSNPKTARDPDKYVMKQQPLPPQGPDQGQQKNGGSLAKPNPPIGANAAAGAIK